MVGGSRVAGMECCHSTFCWPPAEQGLTLSCNFFSQVTERQWQNAEFNFDHLGNALVSLFVVATLNGYSEILDSGDLGRQAV